MIPGALRALYNAALPAVLVAALPGQLLKMRRRGGAMHDFGQRLGHFRPPVAAQLNSLFKPWWIHAVSVGEVLVAAKFIAAARIHNPAQPIVLSTTTSTGHAVARRELPANIPVLYNPVDLPSAVHRTLDTIRPGRLILVEAEVWPNLLHAAHSWGLPVSLINARLSPRSERRYLAARRLVAPVLATLNQVLVPDPEDVARWSSIGVRPEVISVTGSLKHDYENTAEEPLRPQLASLLTQLWGNPLPPLLLAASTHPGEEVALAKAFLTLRLTSPSLRLLVAPRHVERTPHIKSELSSLGLHVTCRSSLPEPASPHGNSSPTPDVLLIDTTGELRAWQPLANVTVIGKSFLAHGGQNPVEALMADRPVVTGPHMENFESLMRRLLAHHAITQVPSLTALTPALQSLLSSSHLATSLASNARTALAPHQGAARRSVEHVLQCHS